MRSTGAARSCPTTSEPDGSAAIVIGSCTSGSRWTSTATEPSRVVRRPTVAARRQLPANGKRTVAWYRPRCFVGRSGTESVFGPVARNVPRAGGDTATTTRYGTPLSAWRGTETAWTRSDGAVPSATRKRSERVLNMIGRFRRIYGGFAASCQVRSQGDPRSTLRGPPRAGGLVVARARRRRPRQRGVAGARARRGAAGPALRGQPRVRRPGARARRRRRGGADPARLRRRLPRHRRAALAGGSCRGGRRRARG